MIDENYFTYEILKDALVAVGDEMFAAMKRTSMSPIVYEILDFAVGVTDARGNLVAQGNGVVLFMATLDSAVRAVLDKHGPDGIHEGDIFITNDPYGGGGTHVSDVTLVLPVFFEGTLIAFVANKAHWTEVGGMAPGGNLTDSTEVYQEGLMFPTVKLFDRGTINQPLVDMIEANVRIPDMTLGDMWASVAANRVGERRIIELVTRYGRDTVTGAMSRILDYGERMVRTELERMPKGEFFAEAMLDGDGLGNGPFHAQVKVTISEDRFLIDFTGTRAAGAGLDQHDAIRHELIRARGLRGLYRSPCSGERRHVPSAGGDLPRRNPLHRDSSGPDFGLLGIGELRHRPGVEGDGAPCP